MSPFQITIHKSKKKIAAPVRYAKSMKDNKVKLGLLEGKASFKMNNFKMTDEEFLRL